MAHYERHSHSESSSATATRGAPTPGSLLWRPPRVRLRGIPREVSAPAPSSSTFYVRKIRGGALGTRDTMQAMTELALEAATDPHFLDEARSITRGLPDRDYEAFERAILDYVWVPQEDEDGVMRPRVQYREGPIAESENGQMVQYLQSPGWTLFVAQSGLCADMSTLIMALDLANGIGGLYRSAALDSADPGRFSHVYAVAIGPDHVARAQDPVPRSPSLGAEPPSHLLTAASKDYIVAQC